MGETESLATAAAEGAAPEAAATVEDLFAADRAFNDDVAANGAVAWAEWFAEDGGMLVPGQLVRGGATILELMGPMLEVTNLTWEPDYGEIAGSGDLGFTTGRYTARPKTGDTTAVSQGRYVTIWRLTADGEWRVALDGGVPDGG